MLYLFIGEDSLSKDIKLEAIKDEFLPEEVRHFNFDCFYARETQLLKLQEALLRLPVKAKKRMVLIREAEKLKENVKDYLISACKDLPQYLLLILDTHTPERTDSFLRGIGRYARVLRFKEKPRVDTFKLSQEIDSRKVSTSLKILNLLLANGEKPERIMGGLRYCWGKNYLATSERNRRLKLLLNCDIDIKTGRLKPAFALEKLLVKLCCFSS